MTVRGLIFDYGGVLWDMRFDVSRALEEEHGVPERAIVETMYASETWRQIEVGIGDREAWLAEAHVALETRAGRALPPLHQRWRDQQRLIAPNIELIERLRPRYRTGVLSNADRTLMHRLREVHRIHHLFDDIVCSADVGMAKPDARVYELAADRLGLRPDECVFIDDMESNVAAARDGGMRGVHFRIELGHSLEEMLREHGVSTDA